MNRKQRRAERRPGMAGSPAGGPPAPLAASFASALAYQRAGRAADAERICRHILGVAPGHAPALHLLGVLEHQRGRSDDAVEHIRAAIARDSRDPAFHHNLGNVLRALRRPAEALGCFEQALALAPGSVDTLYNLANACHDLGRVAEAVGYFERALRLQPDAVELHHNLATALHDLGRVEEAVACFHRALALRPDSVEALDNLAAALRSQGDMEEARACYERALSLEPNRLESRIGLGVVLRELGRLQDALQCCERALALAPDHPETRNNLAVTLVDLDRPAEAAVHYRQVLAVQPDRAETHNNLGIALERQGRPEEAAACYGHALALNPDYPEAHFNRAHALLSTGAFEEGWPEYEWRFAVARYDRGFDEPLWSGELLAGQTILIHAEQGFGDTLQFLRYVPLVAGRGGRVVLEAPRAVARLARTVTGASEVVAAGDALPPFDRHCPLLSLPRVFGTTLATIPGDAPYLSVPREAASPWAERIADAPGLKVGLAWCGSLAGIVDRRPIDLQLLHALSAVPGVSWFSLQVGDRSRDLSSLEGWEIADLSPLLSDFAETAAAVSRLDLVITIDTSVAHLAGALGRPTWVLLPYNSDWRWLRGRRDSPWYPTARLFRQARPGDWPGVVREVAAALTQLVY
jgi:tetratricopeptide (TPR) repeat protein